MATITIGGRRIGLDHPPFVVAEVGINHNGDLDKAFALIRMAKTAGADAVKFQTFKAAEFVGDPHQTYTYRSQGLDVTESMLAMFQRCEFTPDEWRQIKRCCDDEGVTFLSTPQNRSDLALLLELGVPAIKVGSDDFTNLPLLKSYAATDLPLILSCGMADLGEVYAALSAVGAFDGYPTILLLCTSQYPTPPQDVHLAKLRTLAGAFPSLCLGFSDHTEGSRAAALAVALGACFFEKHVTLSHDLPGPDHWFSADPEGLRDWVTAIREGHVMLGSPLVRPTAAELDMRQIARRSVVALRDMAAGECFDETNVGLRRPGTGLAPHLLEQVLGRQAARSLIKGQPLQLGDLS